MRLRTITGTRWPAKCADGCGTKIPAGENVKVVVDFESKPRKTWIPEHSPDAGTWGGRGGGRKEEERSPQARYEGVQASYRPASASTTAPPPAAAASSPTPARTAQAPPPSPPSPPSRPASSSTGEPHVSVEVDHAEEDGNALPSNSVKTYAGGQISLRESTLGFCRVTFSARAQDGESDEQLRARVNRALLQDLEAQAVALRQLRARLGIEVAPAAPRRGREGA